MGKVFVSTVCLLYAYNNYTFNTGNQLNLCGNLSSWLTAWRSEEL